MRRTRNDGYRYAHGAAVVHKLQVDVHIIEKLRHDKVTASIHLHEQKPQIPTQEADAERRCESWSLCNCVQRRLRTFSFR